MKRFLGLFLLGALSFTIGWIWQAYSHTCPGCLKITGNQSTMHTIVFGLCGKDDKLSIHHDDGRITVVDVTDCEKTCLEIHNKAHLDVAMLCEQNECTVYGAKEVSRTNVVCTRIKEIDGEQPKPTPPPSDTFKIEYNFLDHVTPCMTPCVSNYKM